MQESHTFMCFLLGKHIFMCYNYIKRKGGNRVGKKKRKKQERLINLMIEAVAATATLILSIAELIKALK